MSTPRIAAALRKALSPVDRVALSKVPGGLRLDPGDKNLLEALDNPAFPLVYLRAPDKAVGHAQAGSAQLAKVGFQKSSGTWAMLSSSISPLGHLEVAKDQGVGKRAMLDAISAWAVGSRVIVYE